MRFQKTATFWTDFFFNQVESSVLVLVLMSCEDLSLTVQFLLGHKRLEAHIGT